MADSPSSTTSSETPSPSGPIKAPEGSSVLVGDDGQTIVHNQVVAKIAGLAVQEIDGVNRLVPFGAGQTVTSFAKTITRNEMHELGVHVEVGQKEAAVDVRVVTEYEASIPAIADAVRKNVSDRIESMTGLAVVEVNIDVVDLHFPEEDPAQDSVSQGPPRVR